MSQSPFPNGNRSHRTLNPDRIRCARETAGLTKFELAVRLDVTPRTVANYEQIGAPVSQLNGLSQILGVMPSFFTVLPSDPQIEDLSESQVWFRSLRKSTVRQRRSAIGHGRNALLFFRWVEDHFRLPRYDLPYGDSATLAPQQAASMLRGVWGYGENPLPSMTSLAESHGIRLFSLPAVGKEVDAFSFVFHNIPYVAVDLQKTAERIRFDIAHEIGHLLLHEGLLSEGPSSAVRDVESEAHLFAANLLMPERRVRALVPRRATVRQLLEAKKYFKVSAMAMSRQAHEQGLLTDWEYRSICSELASKGYRASEPNGIRREESQVFRFVAQSNRERGISTDTVSEETGLTAKELHDLSFGNLLALSHGSGVSDTSTKTDDSSSTVRRPELSLHVNEKYRA